MNVTRHFRCVFVCVHGIGIDALRGAKCRQCTHAHSHNIIWLTFDASAERVQTAYGIRCAVHFTRHELYNLKSSVQLGSQLLHALQKTICYIILSFVAFLSITGSPDCGVCVVHLCLDCLIILLLCLSRSHDVQVLLHDFRVHGKECSSHGLHNQQHDEYCLSKQTIQPTMLC